MTRREIVEKRPDLVQRFVDASAIGWYHYLYGDNSKANALIKTDNPDISDDQIAFSIEEMKRDVVVDLGDALKLGIGAMTDAHWKDFFDKMAKAGIVGGESTTARPSLCNSSTKASASTCGRNEQARQGAARPASSAGPDEGRRRDDDQRLAARPCGGSGCRQIPTPDDLLGRGKGRVCRIDHRYARQPTRVSRLGYRLDSAIE